MSSRKLPPRRGQSSQWVCSGKAWAHWSHWKSGPVLSALAKQRGWVWRSHVWMRGVVLCIWQFPCPWWSRSRSGVVLPSGVLFRRTGWLPPFLASRKQIDGPIWQGGCLVFRVMSRLRCCRVWVVLWGVWGGWWCVFRGFGGRLPDTIWRCELGGSWFIRGWGVVVVLRRGGGPLRWTFLPRGSPWWGGRCRSWVGTYS